MDATDHAATRGRVGRTVCGAADMMRRELDGLLEGWIGLSVPPAPRALAASDWAPDESTAYCRRCGSSAGPGEATATGCASCRDGAAIGDGVVRLGRYAGDLRRWILGVKFGGWFEMGEVLGRQLGQQVTASGFVQPARTVIVPIGMPWARRAYRGIDHARLLAAGVAATLDAPLVRALGRAGQAPQVTLPASARRRAGRGHRLRRRLGGWPLADLDVVLVDDVLTTGATMRGAMRVLRRLRPRRLVGAVVAVADERSRRGMRRGVRRVESAPDADGQAESP